jgi:hypothetical protein
MLAAFLALFLVAASPPDTDQQIEQQQQSDQHYSAPQPSVEKQETEADKGVGKEKNNQHNVERIFEFLREHDAEIVALSTVVMSVFTVALFFATWLLWITGRRHARQELRAYVLMRDIQLINSDNIVEATAYVRNFGKTPAYDFRLVCTLALRETGTTELKPDPIPRGQQSISTLAPGDETECFRRFEKPLSEEQFALIAEGKLKIFVFGRFDYTDAFGKARFTNFRYFSTPIIRKGDGLGMFLNLSSTGNESN